MSWLKPARVAYETTLMKRMIPILPLQMLSRRFVNLHVLATHHIVVAICV